jgi:hypothetical protein
MVSFASASTWNLVPSGVVVTDVESGCAYVASKRSELGIVILNCTTKGPEIEISLAERINHNRWKEAPRGSLRPIKNVGPIGSRDVR